ncbi:MAG: glycosyltransferase family 4 protein, partial [Planctomycetota bacterium]
AGPDGWGGKRLDRMIRELGIGERVVRPGFVDDEDLPAVYSLADALVFPSVAEGFGFPVLEAMACGTPVIASDIPPLREVAGDAARLVRPGDLPAWRTALEETLADADALRRLAEAGRRHARQYTWAAHGTALAELYRTVLAEDQASGGALPDGEPST